MSDRSVCCCFYSSFYGFHLLMNNLWCWAWAKYFVQTVYEQLSHDFVVSYAWPTSFGTCSIIVLHSSRGIWDWYCVLICNMLHLWQAQCLIENSCQLLQYTLSIPMRTALYKTWWSLCQYCYQTVPLGNTDNPDLIYWNIMHVLWKVGCLWEVKVTHFLLFPNYVRFLIRILSLSVCCKQDGHKAKCDYYTIHSCVNFGKEQRFNKDHEFVGYWTSC